jgi:hypothetical protein
MATLRGMLGGDAQDGGMGTHEADGDPKNAMDQAIAEATRKVKADMNALSVAREEVRPLMSAPVPLALDSAEAVYRVALLAQGYDLAGVHASAYGSMVKHALKNAKAPASHTIAQDTAQTVTALEAGLGFALPPVPRSY